MESNTIKLLFKISFPVIFTVIYFIANLNNKEIHIASISSFIMALVSWAFLVYTVVFIKRYNKFISLHYFAYLPGVIYFILQLFISSYYIIKNPNQFILALTIHISLLFIYIIFILTINVTNKLSIYINRKQNIDASFIHVVCKKLDVMIINHPNYRDKLASLREFVYCSPRCGNENTSTSENRILACIDWLSDSLSSSDLKSADGFLDDLKKQLSLRNSLLDK